MVHVHMRALQSVKRCVDARGIYDRHIVGNRQVEATNYQLPPEPPDLNVCAPRRGFIPGGTTIPGANGITPCDGIPPGGGGSGANWFSGTGGLFVPGTSSCSAALVSSRERFGRAATATAAPVFAKVIAVTRSILWLALLMKTALLLKGFLAHAEARSMAG